MRCPSCNAKIPDDVKVCPECGKKLKKKYKRRYEQEIENRKKAANGLVVLIIILCTLLLVGFILVAVRLLLVDENSGRSWNLPFLNRLLQTETDAGESWEAPELTGESILPAEELGQSTEAKMQSADGSGQNAGANAQSADGTVQGAGENRLSAGTSDGILIENPPQILADSADYNLTEQASVTITGQMYQLGSEKELMLPESKSFYGNDATGMKVMVSQADTIHFASSRSKVSVQELREIPNGADLICTGELYIYDDQIFIRLENIAWSVPAHETAIG